MNYSTVLFDLDGTLTDPGEGITNSVAYALEKFGIHIADRRELYRFIGPPLIDSFMMFYGFDRKDAELAVTYYREYYTTQGIFENKLYDGILPTLKKLHDAGVKILTATSKPEMFAVQILEYFDIARYFTYIAGAAMDESRTAKDEVISYALASVGLTGRGDVLMVGDRLYDINGAKKIGIDSVGVLFGYGSREELRTAGATYLAERPEDILPIVLGNDSGV